MRLPRPDTRIPVPYRTHVRALIERNQGPTLFNVAGSLRIYRGVHSVRLCVCDRFEQKLAERGGLCRVSEPRDRTGVRAWLPTRMMCVWGAGKRGKAVVGGSDGVAGFIIDGSGGMHLFHFVLRTECTPAYPS